MAFACATQSYDVLVSAFGSKVNADAFLDQFQSWMLLKTSENTFKYMAEKMGVALMTVFKRPVAGLDYKAGVAMIQNATINDPQHPMRSMMMKLKRMGVGRLGTLPKGEGDAMFRGQKATGMSGDDLMKTITVPTGGKLEIQPLFRPEEFTELLQGRGKAILMLQRAGVRRVDWVDTIYTNETELAAKPKA